MGEETPEETLPGQAPYTYMALFEGGPWGDGKLRGIALDVEQGQTEPPDPVLLPTGRYLRVGFSDLPVEEDLTGTMLSRGAKYRWENAAERRKNRDISQLKED